MDPIVLRRWQRTQNVDFRRKTKLCFGVCVLQSWMFLRSSFVLLASAFFCDGDTAAWFQWLQEEKQESACGCDHDASHRGHVTLVSYQCDMIPVVSKISHNQSSLGFLQLHPPSAWNCSTLQDDSKKVSVEADEKQQSFQSCVFAQKFLATLTAAFLVMMPLTTPSLLEIDIFLLWQLFEDISCFGAEHHKVARQHFLFPKMFFSEFRNSFKNARRLNSNQ